MKNIKLLLLLGCLFYGWGIKSTYAFSIHPSTTLTPNETVRFLKAKEFVKLSTKEFARLAGKKMSLWHKLSFTLAKLKLKHELRKDPELKQITFQPDVLQP